MIAPVDVNPTSKIAANDGVIVHVQWHILWSFMAFLNWKRCVFSVCYGLSIEHIAIIDWSTGFSPVPCRQMFKTPLSRKIVYTEVLSSFLVPSEVYPIQHFVIKFFGDLQHVSYWFFPEIIRFHSPIKTYHHDTTEILLPDCWFMLTKLLQTMT
jgi:hypothetical protein